MILVWIEGTEMCNTQRRGKTSKPLAVSERLMISRCSEEPPEMLRLRTPLRDPRAARQ
jgi:hypothetical protein